MHAPTTTALLSPPTLEDRVPRSGDSGSADSDPISHTTVTLWQAKPTVELGVESPDAEDRHCGLVDVCRNTRLQDVRVQVMDDWDDDQLPDNSKMACWSFEVDGSRISPDAVSSGY